MTHCIVNFARGHWFKRPLELMLDSLITQQSYQGPLLLFKDESEIGAPRLEDIPYGFKPYAIIAAAKMGYSQILWLDCSVRVISDIQPAFDMLSQDGYLLLQNADNPDPSDKIGPWASDEALEKFSVSRDIAMGLPTCAAGVFGVSVERNPTRDQAMSMPTTCGTFFGLDLTNSIGSAILAGLMQNLPLFRGSYSNENGQVSKDPRCLGHRHDQTILSLVAWRLGIDARHQWVPLKKIFYRDPRPLEKL